MTKGTGSINRNKLPIIGKNKTAINRMEYNAVNMAPSVIERIEYKFSPHISLFFVLCMYYFMYLFRYFQEIEKKTAR